MSYQAFNAAQTASTLGIGTIASTSGTVFFNATTTTAGNTSAFNFVDAIYSQRPSAFQAELESLKNEIRQGMLLKRQSHVIARPLALRTLSYDRVAPRTDNMLIQFYGVQLPALKEKYLLPDGAIMVIDEHGNYGIDDADAKVIYRANKIREFNPYINASDLLEHFIGEVGAIDGVDQGEILRLPVEAFIHWIILQAAKRDGDPTDGLPTVESALPPPPPQLALPAPALKPRCASCGRFIRKTWAAAQIVFCSPQHMISRLEKLGESHAFI